MKKTNENIIKELVDSMNQCFAPKVSKSNIVLYLLGDKNDDEEHSLSPSACSNIYNGKTESLKPEHARRFARSSDWSIERMKSCIGKPFVFDTSLLTQSVKNIFDSYISDSSLDNQTFDLMIKSLLSLNFFNSDDITDFFDTYAQKLCENYVLWTDKYQDLENALYEQNLVFITGAPGSGKTQLAKYYIEKNLKTFWDIAWVEGPYTTFEQCLENIAFLSYEECLFFDEVKEILSYKTEKSLLVIDLPVITKEDLFWITSVAKSTTMKIIITTRSQESLSISEIPKVCLNNWPDDLLVQIFSNYCKLDCFTEDEFHKLFEIISRNPFTLIMIAKSFVTQNKSTKKSSFSKNDFLNEKEWIWNNKNLPKIKGGTYVSNNSGQLILNQILNILEKYDSKFLTYTGSKLSIFAKSEISYAYLEKQFSFDELTSAFDIGLLEYCDEDKTIVKMPALIADAIWHKFPMEFREYLPITKDFLTHIENNTLLPQSHKMRYSLILNLIYRFHYQVISISSRFTKKEKEDTGTWFGLLLQVIQKLIELGNIRSAYDIAAQLYLTRSKSKQEFPITSSFELALKNLLKQFCYFIADPGQIDKLIEANETFLKEVSDIGRTEDVSISLFILNQIHFYMIRTEHLNDIDIISSPERFEMNDITHKIYLCLRVNEEIYKNHNYLTNKKEFTVEGRYFEIVLLYIYALTNPSSINIKQPQCLQGARKLLHTITDQSLFSDYWNYKTLLEGLFYECIISISSRKTGFPLRRIAKSYLNDCFEKMNFYFQNFSSYWDIVWLYNLNTVLYNLLLHQTDVTPEYWISVFKSFSHMANEQIVLSDDYKNRTLEAINTAKEKIHKISD